MVLVDYKVVHSSDLKYRNSLEATQTIRKYSYTLYSSPNELSLDSPVLFYSSIATAALANEALEQYFVFNVVCIL